MLALNRSEIARKWIKKLELSQFTGRKWTFWTKMDFVKKNFSFRHMMPDEGITWRHVTNYALLWVLFSNIYFFEIFPILNVYSVITVSSVTPLRTDLANALKSLHFKKIINFYLNLLLINNLRIGKCFFITDNAY